MSFGRGLAAISVIGVSLLLGGCDTRTAQAGASPGASPQAGFEVSVNGTATKKLEENRYEYNKSVSMVFETTGSVRVESKDGRRPSGILVVVYAETTGILETGTAPKWTYVPVSNGEGRFRIYQYESYAEGGSTPSGVPNYEFRKFGFTPLEQFAAPPAPETLDDDLKWISFKATPQSVFKSRNGDYFRGRTEIEIIGEGALKTATFVTYVSRTATKAAAASSDSVGDINILEIPVIDGRASLTQITMLESIGYNEKEKEPPAANEYEWTVLGYSTDLQPIALSGEPR